MQCKNCGDPVDPRRVELGYDYCTKEECQQRCLKGVELAAVAVNKAADYYSSAAEVARPRRPATIEIEADETTPDRDRMPRPAIDTTPRPKTTSERLRDREADLDDALKRSYERFREGQITAQEMDRECAELVGSFNQRVMSENIRYRSMLRRRPA